MKLTVGIKLLVRGELKYYPKFLEFGINTSKTWEPVQLSKFHTLHDGRYYKESFCSCKMPLL